MYRIANDHMQFLISLLHFLKVGLVCFQFDQFSSTKLNISSIDHVGFLTLFHVIRQTMNFGIQPFSLRTFKFTFCHSIYIFVEVLSYENLKGPFSGLNLLSGVEAQNIKERIILFQNSGASNIIPITGCVLKATFYLVIGIFSLNKIISVFTSMV